MWLQCYFLFQLISSHNGDASDEDDPEFRYLSTDCGIQPSKRNNYGIPKDVIDMFRASSNQSANTLDDIIANRLEDVRLSHVSYVCSLSHRNWLMFSPILQVVLNQTDDN